MVALAPVTLTEIAQEPPATITPPLRLIIPLLASAETVPLQLLLSPGALTTVSPAGQVIAESYTAEQPAAGERVRVGDHEGHSEVIPQRDRGWRKRLADARRRDYKNAGGCGISSSAFVGGDANAVVLLPSVIPVTFTENVQDVFVVSVALDKLTEVEPATAEAVPPQTLFSPLSGVATTKPAGKLSVKPTPVSEVVFADGLVMVKLSEVDPFSGMLDAPNDLTMVGGVATVNAGRGDPPPWGLHSLCRLVQSCCSRLRASTATGTDKVHEPLAATVPPGQADASAAWGCGECASARVRGSRRTGHGKPGGQAVRKGDAAEIDLGIRIIDREAQRGGPADRNAGGRERLADGGVRLGHLPALPAW